MTLRAWIEPRRSTLVSIALGTATWLAALAIAWRLWPGVAPREAAGDRLAYAAQLLSVVAVLVLLLVSSCFRAFDTVGAERDVFAGAESPAWKVNQRVLQNTVEQSLIFVPALLALATRLPAGELRILPILTTLWAAGRVLFWVGFRIAPRYRGPGFEWTLFSSALALGWFIRLAVG